ncbi:MAG: type II toxin-antitoxin system prevent-host-death family antitoxin [Acidimicrobiales bacterium]
MPTDVTIPTTDARGQLAELVNRVAYSGDHVTLTRDGRGDR